jgi:23S rRNA (adenine1618-N6)-methyltransferase
MMNPATILDDMRLNVLSIHYPALQQYLKINKHLDLDFEWDNNEALIQLNIALFDHYFEIKWKFPCNGKYLIPRLPIRLKYLCWISELLPRIPEFQSNQEKTTFDGIDIGTGANLVLPLLGKSVFNWKFLGTEINKSSLKQATKILSKNPGFESRIELRKVESGFLKGVVSKKTEQFRFLCCNPPFYSNKKQKELIEKKNFTGASHEIYYKHGEVGFIFDIIKESLKFVGSIGVFTCF